MSTSTLAQLLAARALETIRPKENTENPLDKVTQEALEAGVSVDWRDMTATERKKATDRRHAQRKRQAAYTAQVLAEALGEDGDNDTADEQPYDHDRYMTASASLTRWYPMTKRIAFQAYRRIERYLGGAGETGRPFSHLDVAQELHLRLARQVAREDINLTRFSRDITWLLDTYGGVPHDVPGTHPEAQWLCRRARLYARWTIRSLYRQSPSLLSIEALDTVFSSTGGIDTMIEATKASCPPSMNGYRFPNPGAPDPLPVAIMIDQEIARQGLDEVVDLLTSAETLPDGRLKYRRNDGSFRWTTYGTQIMDLLDVHYNREASNRINGVRAMRMTRKAFEWLPGYLGAILDAGVEAKLPHEDRYWSIIVQFPDPDAMARAIAESADEILEVLTK